MSLEIDYDEYPHARGHEKDIVDGGEGRLRYRKNEVVRWLLNFSSITFDQIWTTYEAGAFSLEDMMEFYRLIGYSLVGFEEIWHERDPATATKMCSCGEQPVEDGSEFCSECLET
jgi:hypothetical protein